MSTATNMKKKPLSRNCTKVNLNIIPESQPTSDDIQIPSVHIPVTTTTTTSANTILKKEELLKLIEEIDPSSTLIPIYLIDNIPDDILVEKYFCLLSKFKTLPQLNGTFYEDILKSSNDTYLTHNFKDQERMNNTMKEVVINFMSAMQSSTCSTNLNDASNANKAVFNPKVTLKVPNYNNMQKSTFYEIAAAKKYFASCIQQIMVKGQLFVQQLKVLESMELIDVNLQSTTTNNEDSNKLNSTLFFLSIAFFKAETEMMKKVPTKEYKWNEYKSKITVPLPAWRRESKAPPLTYCRHADLLIKKFENNVVSFEPAVVLNENKHAWTKLENDVTNTDGKGSSQNHSSNNPALPKRKLWVRKRIKNCNQNQRRSSNSNYNQNHKPRRFKYNSEQHISSAVLLSDEE